MKLPTSRILEDAASRGYEDGYHASAQKLMVDIRKTVAPFMLAKYIEIIQARVIRHPDY